MKSATRRKQQQEDLRAKILDAARELFVNEGVEAVSMRKVADKIGYSATTFITTSTTRRHCFMPCATPTSERFKSCSRKSARSPTRSIGSANWDRLISRSHRAIPVIIV